MPSSRAAGTPGGQNIKPTNDALHQPLAEPKSQWRRIGSTTREDRCRMSRTNDSRRRIPKLRAALVAVVTGAAAVGLPASPAAAAEDSCAQYGAWATGCFKSDGDWVQVWDNRSDGLRAQVVWGTDYGRSGLCAIRSGEDLRYCNYNLAEGHRIRIVLEMIDVNTGERVWGSFEDVAI